MQHFNDFIRKTKRGGGFLLFGVFLAPEQVQ